MADAKPDDIKDLLGGALFQALYKWMIESGPVYLLPTGPVSSFLVVSDPEAAKHVLRGPDNPTRNVYDKGLVAEVSQVRHTASKHSENPLPPPPPHTPPPPCLCPSFFSGKALQ